MQQCRYSHELPKLSGKPATCVDRFNGAGLQEGARFSVVNAAAYALGRAHQARSVLQVHG